MNMEEQVPTFNNNLIQSQIQRLDEVISSNQVTYVTNESLFGSVAATNTTITYSSSTAAWSPGTIVQRWVSNTDPYYTQIKEEKPFKHNILNKIKLIK